MPAVRSHDFCVWEHEKLSTLERHFKHSRPFSDVTYTCVVSLSLIRSCRLPNLRIMTFFAVGLLIYDIFFVFVTPLFTSVSAGRHAW